MRRMHWSGHRRGQRFSGCSPEAIEDIAAQVNPAHAALVAAGARLTARSSLWGQRGGLMTLRLVYRDRRGGLTIAVTARDLSIAGV